MHVFRHYDQAELELQYNSAARSPELSAQRDARAAKVDAEAAEVRRTAKARLDLAYGRHPREKIDFFAAERAGGPLLVYIHGGYWKQRYKDEHAWMAPAFTARGINFATLGYPLCPEVRIGEIVGSCRRALAFLAGKADELAFNVDNVNVAGHSAGGHLTAMMGMTDFSQHGSAAGLVKSATCISGLYDLEPLRLVTHNKELNIRAEDVEPLSPLRHTPQPGVVVNITVGDQEADEFVRNTIELGEAWSAKGVDVTMVDAAGFHHFDILDEFARAGRPMFNRVVDVIESQRGPKS